MKKTTAEYKTASDKDKGKRKRKHTDMIKLNH